MIARPKVVYNQVMPTKSKFILPNSFQLRDGIYYPKAKSSQSTYQKRWDHEASTDHLKSAIAVTSEIQSWQQLTLKASPFWDSHPKRKHYQVILELGCGYGRIPIYLSKARGVTCDDYVGVDISEVMLAKCSGYMTKYKVFTRAQRTLICHSADQLKLPENSVDLVISSAVLLHMGKPHARKALTQLAKALKPKGEIVLDSSFPNVYSPANYFDWMVTKLPITKTPNYLKYYSISEICELMESSGLTRKAGPFAIEPYSYGPLPKAIWKLPLPIFRHLNPRIQPYFPDWLAAVGYSVWTK